jgi:hypothetical protein
VQHDALLIGYKRHEAFMWAVETLLQKSGSLLTKEWFANNYLYLNGNSVNEEVVGET